MPFWQPFHNFFAKSWILSLRDRKRPNNYFSLQKNLQTFRWTRRLQFWQSCQTFWHQKWNNSAQRPKSLSKASSFQRNVLKCSSEHFERSFENSANFLHLIVQNSLLEIQKLIKKHFFYKFFPPIFFVLVGRFFATITFLSKAEKNAQTPKQMNKYKFLWKKTYFSSKKCL